MVQRSVPHIFSPQRRAARARRAVRRQTSADAARFVHDAMAEDVIERLGFMQVEPKAALVIGDLIGTVTQWLRQSGVTLETREIGSFDEESPFALEEYDLVITLGALDTLNDVPGALLVLNAALKKGGLLLAVFPGAGSLTSLRAAMLEADGDRPAAHPSPDRRARWRRFAGTSQFPQSGRRFLSSQRDVQVVPAAG